MTGQVLIHSVEGREIYLDALRPGDITLRVVSSGLSHTCRFAGQLDEFYSVAQHAILVSLLVPEELRLPALHHDDSEALMADLSRRLKHHPEMNWYRTLEGQVQRECNRSAGITAIGPAASKLIKTADDLAAVYERSWIRDQRPFELSDVVQACETKWIRRTTVQEMARLVKRLPTNWWPWDSATARRAFVEAHDEYSAATPTGLFL